MHTGITTALGMQVWDFLGTTCKTGMTRWCFSWLEFDGLNQCNNTVVKIVPRTRLLQSICSAPKPAVAMKKPQGSPWQTAVYAPDTNHEALLATEKGKKDFFFFSPSSRQNLGICFLCCLAYKRGVGPVAVTSQTILVLRKVVLCMSCKSNGVKLYQLLE